MKTYSVEQFIEISNKELDTTEITRGSVEFFRVKLREYSLINDRESLNDTMLNYFIEAFKLKKENNLTWDDAFDLVLEKDKNKNRVIANKFYINYKIIIEDIIWRIKNNSLKITPYLNMEEGNKENELFHVIFHVLIPNYVALSDKEPRFKKSAGTDGNPLLSYLLEGTGYKYILLGKLNPITKDEDIHIYFNDGDILHPMKLKFIGYISKNEKIYNELVNALKIKR